MKIIINIVYIINLQHVLLLRRKHICDLINIVFTFLVGWWKWFILLANSMMLYFFLKWRGLKNIFKLLAASCKIESKTKFCTMRYMKYDALKSNDEIELNKIIIVHTMDNHNQVGTDCSRVSSILEVSFLQMS